MRQDPCHQLHEEDDQQQAEILGARRGMVTLGIRAPCNKSLFKEAGGIRDTCQGSYFPHPPYFIYIWT